MKNHLIKKIALVLAMLILCICVTACGSDNSVAQSVIYAQPLTPAETEAPTEAPVVVATVAPTEVPTVAPTEAPAAEPTVAPTEAPAVAPTEAPAQVNTEENAAFTGNWVDMQFTLDGVLYQLPMSYKELESAGWTFDLADYGYDNGYIMNPGDMVYSTIQLENPAYSDRLDMTVGFVNNSDEVKDIMQCDIWSLELNTCYGFTQVENYPAMSIGNGLHFGSTHEEVLAAMGQCDDIYESADYGYSVYNYDYDFTYYMKITVYDDLGITAFDLCTYD